MTVARDDGAAGAALARDSRARCDRLLTADEYDVIRRSLGGAARY